MPNSYSVCRIFALCSVIFIVSSCGGDGVAGPEESKARSDQSVSSGSSAGVDSTAVEQC